MRKNEKQLNTRSNVIIPNKLHNRKRGMISHKKISLFMFLSFILLTCSCYKKTSSVEQSEALEEVLKVAEEQSEALNNIDYLDGFQAGDDYYGIRKDIVTLYKGDAITYEQLNTYVKRNLDLIRLSLTNNISAIDIRNYNSSIEGIGLIDYNKYQLNSTESYINGFKDYIQLNCYKQIVNYYHDLNQIPDEKYEAFQVVYDNNAVIDEEKLAKIVNYARDIIKDCLGDPEEVVLSDEWRVYPSIEEFLTKPF